MKLGSSFTVLALVAFSSWLNVVDAIPPPRTTQRATTTTKPVVQGKSSSGAPVSRSQAFARPSSSVRASASSSAVAVSRSVSSSAASRSASNSAVTSSLPASSRGQSNPSGSGSSGVLSSSAPSSAASASGSASQSTSNSAIPVSSGVASGSGLSSAAPTASASGTSSDMDKWYNYDPKNLTAYTFDPKAIAPTPTKFPGTAATHTPVDVTQEPESSIAVDDRRSLSNSRAFRVRGVSLSTASGYTVLYHGTCLQDLQSMQQQNPLVLQSNRRRPDEFSYKGGFYLTPDHENAKRFIRSYKAHICAQRGGMVVAKFRLYTPGLRVLDVGDRTQRAQEFWSTQRYIGAVLNARQQLAPQAIPFVNAVDNADVITGTVPLGDDQVVGFPNPPTDPFQQVVIVTNTGMAALQLRRYTAV